MNGFGGYQCGPDRAFDWEEILVLLLACMAQQVVYGSTRGGRPEQPDATGQCAESPTMQLP